MKKHFSILILCYTIFVLGSCTKKTEIIDPPPYSIFRVDKKLGLDSEKRAYYQHSDRFYTFHFTNDTAQRVYEVTLSPEILYRSFLQGQLMDQISFYIADKNGNRLAEGSQGNIGNTSLYFTYTTTAEMPAFIVVKNEGGSLNVNKDFRLIFEEAGTQVLEWANRSWLADGDWEVTDNEILRLKNHQSGIYRWIRLLDDTPLDYSVSLHMQQDGGYQTTLCGMSVKSGTSIFQMLNIPASGRMFLMNGPQWWELWYIHMETGGGIGRDYGDLPSPLNTGTDKWNSLRIDARPDSLYFFVNQLKTTSVLTQTYDNSIYITVNDADTNKIYFKDFFIESR